MSTVKAPNGTIYEKRLIGAGLSQLGSGGDYEIVTADEPDIVENTAAEELKKVFGKAGLNIGIVPESKSTGRKRFLLGRDSTLKAIAHFSDRGDLKIRDVSPQDDGFHLKQVGNDIVIAGANPRGVLYGVYAFEDFVMKEVKSGVLDVRTIPCFRKRMSAPGHYFNSVNFPNEGLPEEKAIYLSRIGANQVILLDLGVVGTVYCKLQTYVKSDVFPFQPPPFPDLQTKLKSAGALCRKYGIDVYFWFEEPILPSLAGGVEKYPPEALGTVKRPWGGDRDGLDRTLCVSSLIVQEHYKCMVKKFVREYPDVKGIAFYNLDGSSWLCTPALCPRCKSVCKESPPDRHNPWESQAAFVTHLAQAAREERPDFDLRFWGNVHYNDDIEKLLHAAQGYGSLMSFWNGSDRDIMIPEHGEPDRSFDVSLAAAKDRKIPLYGLIEFNNLLDAIPNGLPFPFSVCSAITRYEQRGLKNIMEFAGPLPGLNQINALVAQRFILDPEQSPEKLLADLSVQQFGVRGGELMYKAWEEIKRAFDVWNDDMKFHPLQGSMFFAGISPGFAGNGLSQTVLPDIVSTYNSTIQLYFRVEPYRAADFEKLKEIAFLDNMMVMSAHLAAAAEVAKQAVGSASDKEFIGICYYGAAEARPTQKEYAELNYASIAIADALCRQRCDVIRAYQLRIAIEKSRSVGDEKSALEKEKLCLGLVRDDIGVQERFSEMLTRFAEMRPCFTRTSLTEPEIAKLLSGTKTKIEKLKTFLATPTTPCLPSPSGRS